MIRELAAEVLRTPERVRDDENDARTSPLDARKDYAFIVTVD
jgi:hypothetical protein